jgi:hypothetical protein
VFSVDPSLQGIDIEPPGAPAPVSGSASRFSGKLCRGDTCVVSTCGSTGSVSLRLTPAVDDQTELAELGYRLQLVQGNVAPELEAALSSIVHAPPGVDPDLTLALQIEVPYEEVVSLDATFELVAVDRAGNESMPSEAFPLAFDGCTHAPDLDGCVEDIEAEMSCSAAPAGAPRASGGWAAAAVAFCMLAQRRRAPKRAP